MLTEFLKVAEKSHFAEQSVLGGLMICNGAWEDVGTQLLEDDFYAFPHRLIYRAITLLSAQHKPFDILTIAEMLKQMGEITNVGGELYLFELVRDTPTAANIKAYADIVKNTALDRRLLKAGQKIMQSVTDQEECRLDKAQQLLSQISNATTDEVIKRYDRLPHVLAAIDDRRGQAGGISGLTTGFADLDKITAGLHKGELIVVGARPSMGKTAFVLNLADNAAIVHKKSVVIFSLEMDKDQLIERSLAGLARVNMHSIKSGEISQAESEKIVSVTTALANEKLIIDDRSTVSIYDIRTRCRQVKRESGLDLIIVDYIGLMSGDGENETLRVGNISRGLKLIARDLQVPLIAVSQLNRGLESRVGNKRPMMGDIRQSGAIEQDADLIMFLYRDEIYNQDAEKGKAEVIIAKNRNGAIGTVNLTFRGEYCKFENYVETNYIPPQRSNNQQKWGAYDY